MLPYIFVFFILSVASFSPFTKEFKNQKNIIFLFCALLLVLFSGLRNNGVGDDDISYYEFFIYNAPNLYEWFFGSYTYDINKHHLEIGYVFINSFVRAFTSSYIALFFVVSLFSVGIASYKYKIYSKYVFLTLILFFVHTYLYRDLNQIRSAIASAISLFLISYIHDRKNIKVFITLGFSGLFHLASVSLIFVYLFSFLNLTRIRAVFIYLLALLVGGVGGSQLVIQLIPGGGFFSSKLYAYTANKDFATAVSFFDMTNIKNSFILLSIFVFWNRLEKVVPYFKTIVLFYLLGVAIRLGFWDLGVLAARISTFFTIVEVIIIPYFIDVFKQKKLITFLILIYAFITLYLNLFVKLGRHPYELSIF